MAQEIIQKPYYDTIGSKWIDIHQSVKCCLEAFLSDLLFKGDLSRVIYSVPDITFRRRVELMDQGKSENLELSPLSLGLPYASYYQASDWEEDDRGWTQNVSQAIKGLYDMQLYRFIRSLACKSTYKIQAFFSRRDDVRVAQQLLYWEKSPKHPIWLYSSFTWKEKPLAIPAYVTIESINTAPEWKDLDYLAKSRIFPIEIEVTIRSYQVLLPNINNIIPLPIRWSNPAIGASDDDTIYITEETLLEFAVKKWNFDIDENKINVQHPQLIDAAKKYFEDSSYTEAQMKKLGKSLLSNTTYDIIRGYFTESTEVNLDAFFYYEPTSTPNSAVIKYKVKKADEKYFDKIVFVVPGQENIEVKKYAQRELVIKNLYPNSTYDCKILTYSKLGNITTFNLKFTTKDDENSQTPTPGKINKPHAGLVGLNI